MKWISHAIWLAVALACGSVLADDEIRWQTDLMTAKRASAQFKVPLLVHFYGDNCLPCEMLEQRVYSQKDAIETLNRYFICAKINATRNPALAAQYNVHRWPTDVFLAPDGSLLHQDVSKQDVNSYLGVLHSVAVMNRDRNVTLAGAQNPNASPSTQPAYAENNTSASPSTAEQLASNTQPQSQYNTFYANQTALNRDASKPDDVVAGPTTFANRPDAMQSATSRESTLITGTYHPSQDHTLAADQTTSGQLPARQTPAGTLTSQALRVGTGPSTSLAGYQSMPTSDTAEGSKVPAQLASSSTSTPTGNGFSGSSTGTTLENPYCFPPGPDSVENLSPEVRDSRIAAQADEAVQAAQIADPSQPTFDGYCVIAAKQRQWLPGKPELAVKHRGKVYWFSSVEAQQRFLAAPDKCAPLLSGYDPYIFLTQGRMVPGSIQHTLHERLSDQLLLFSSEESKNAYFPQHDETTFARNTSAIIEIIQRSERR